MSTKQFEYNYIGDLPDLDKAPICYMNNENLKRHNTEISMSQEQIKELTRVSLDIEYFVRNYVYINTLDDGVQKFKLRKYQTEFIKDCYNNKFVMGMWGRQMGKCIVPQTILNVRIGKVEKEIQIKDLFDLSKVNDSVIICSDSPDKKFEQIVMTNNIQVECPSGWQNIKSVMKTVKYPVWKIETFNGLELECADNHLLIMDDFSERYVKDISIGERINTKHGTQIVSNVQNMYTDVNMYDIEIEDNAHLYYSNDITSHNTTTVMAYLLHQAITRDNITIAVLANKGESAVEILDRIKNSYELLPFYMQVGVKSWNKRTVELGNGTRIIAAATSSSSIRGKSINCVSGYSKATFMLPDGSTQVMSIYDIIDSGFVKFKHKKFNQKGEINFRYFYENKLLKIKTPNGYRMFDGVLCGKYKDMLYEICTKKHKLFCTKEHKIMINEIDYKHANELQPNDIIMTSDGLEKIKSIQVRNLNKNIEVFDFLDIKEDHVWYSDGILSHQCLYIDEFAHIDRDVEFYTSTYPVISSGKTTQVLITSTPKGMNLFYKLWTDSIEGRNKFLTRKYLWSENPVYDQEWYEETKANTSPVQFAQEYECEFLGSSSTLIAGSKLQQLSFKQPIEELSNKVLNVYENPKEGHTYVGVIDTGEGVGEDSSVMTVFDITTAPYKIVAKYRNNMIPPVMFAGVVDKIGRKYNDAYLIIENNSIGSIVASSLFYDYEYENMFTAASKDGDLTMSMADFTPGVKTTKKTKSIGCSQLKSLIESDTLIIEDFDAITELSTFSQASNGTYKAERGKHDDVVMTLVIFAWATTQEYFSDLTNTNVRKHIRQSYDDEFDCIFFHDGVIESVYEEPEIVTGIDGSFALFG